MFLGAGPNVETRYIYELTSDTDMALPNEDTGMVDGLRKTLLVDLCLKTALKELLRGKLKDVIKFELVLGQEAIARHATEKGSTLEDALGVLWVEGEQCTSGFAELCQGILAAPDLTLASESVLADKLELGIKTFFSNGRRGVFL